MLFDGEHMLDHNWIKITKGTERMQVTLFKTKVNVFCLGHGYRTAKSAVSWDAEVRGSNKGWKLHTEKPHDSYIFPFITVLIKSSRMIVGREKCWQNLVGKPEGPLKKPGRRWQDSIKEKRNSVTWVRERTIPTERPPRIGEVSDNFCG
jgi:hypothetical protein